MLAVGAGCLDIFTLVHHFFLLSSSLADGPIKTEILSQKVVKPQNNHPTNNFLWETPHFMDWNTVSQGRETKTNHLTFATGGSQMATSVRSTFDVKHFFFFL